MARDTWRIRIEAPTMARAIRPGQFLMLRLPGRSDPLLGRPFALFDVVGDALDVVYLVVGKVTGLMASLRAGAAVEVWGPLGNGFQPLATSDHVALVAGGIGQTPFLAYLRELLGTHGYGGDAPRRRANRVSLFYGVRTADLAAGVEDFRAAGAEVHLASDDGSLGFKGFVTTLLARSASDGSGFGHVIGCGPEPMLHALASLCHQLNIPCHLSLETPMACGLGICFSCVARVKTPDGWDYKRVCIDGPIFDAAILALDGCSP
jgi:dihydroorotate dehydrogenase electron transfer subunit